MAKKAKYYQEGGPLVPTGIPAAGHAAQPIANYLAGTTPGAPLGSAGLSYQPGQAQLSQAQRIADQRGIRQLGELGVAAPLAQQLVETGRYREDDPSDTGRLSPLELKRLQETGHAGQVLGENTIGGWRVWDETSGQGGLTAAERIGPDYSHFGDVNIPGVGTALAGAAGGWNRAAQRKLVDAGGVTYNIGGQPVTVGPGGEVQGTLPAGVTRGDVVTWAKGQGQEITTPEFELPSFLSGVGEFFGFGDAKKAKEAEAAAEAARVAEEQRVANERAAAQARLDIARRGGDPYRNESDDDFRDRTQAASSRIDWSAPSDADLEDVYGGTTDWNFKHGGPVEEDIRIAQSRIKDAPLAQARPQIATPAGMQPQKSLGSQLGQHVTGKLLESALGGGVLGGTGGILAASVFNKGGMVEYKEMGGMVGGPLGMKDMQSIGRSEDISKVKMKSAGKDQSHEVEVSYHAPLSYQQPKGE